MFFPAKEKTREEEKYNIRYTSSEINKCCKNTIKAGGSTAICKMSDWMGEWVIPLRLLRLLEHLAVLIDMGFFERDSAVKIE